MSVAEHTPIPEPAAPARELVQLPTIDPTKPAIISAWGRKGSGKSVFNRRLYASWPYDKLCVDVNGDAQPGPDAVPLERDTTGRLPLSYPAPPARMPGEPPARPRNLYYRANPGSPTYYDDLDRAIALGLYPQGHRALVWAGEVAEFMPNAQRTGPNMRVALHQNRHYNTTLLFDGPRPAHVNRLVLGQSDFIAVFMLPDPDDRARIAKEIGYPPARFDRECDETFGRGEYWFLLWAAGEHQLYRCPPLPPD